MYDKNIHTYMIGMYWESGIASLLNYIEEKHGVIQNKGTETWMDRLYYMYIDNTLSPLQ